MARPTWLGLRRSPPTPEAGVFLRADWIKTVATTPDSELRAHRIALTYRWYSLELDEIIHGKPLVERRQPRSGEVECNANWFNFATWGTLTVTQNIGNVHPPQRLNSGLGAPLRRRLTPVVLRARAADKQRVGRALAWGQRLMFVSTSLGFVHWARTMRDGGQPSMTTFEESREFRLLEELTDSELGIAGGGEKGEPNWWLKRDRHLEPVWEALRRYAAAREADPRSRAQLVLDGNLLLTEVEQDLVDPALSWVVDLIPRKLGSSLDWRRARLVQRLTGVSAHRAYMGLQFRHESRRRFVDVAWSRFMTDQVLVISLPTETLRVGRDLPPRVLGAPFYPPDLDRLGPDQKTPTAYRDDLIEVAEHVRSLDRTIDDGRGSAARDWRRWDERMNWAVALMRSRQHDETLFWLPYLVADEQRILEGELPQRSGDPSVLEVQAPLDPFVFHGADLDAETRQ